MNFEQALEDMKRRPLTDFYELEKSKNGAYCCPICNSGKGVHKSGALKLYDNPHRVQCFSGGCFTDKGEDTPGALMRLWKCSLPEVLKKAGYAIDSQTQTAPAQTAEIRRETPKPEPQREDMTEQYKEWHKALLASSKALDYLKSRGIEAETIEHFLIGYASEWVHPKFKDYANPYTEERIIIPRTRTSYTARALNDTSEHKYMTISAALFNSRALTSAEAIDSKMPIVVVEGEIDCMLIWQLGYKEVIALGSTSNKSAFLKAAKEKNPAGVYVLALDNDAVNEQGKRPGQDTQAEIAAELDKAGIAYISADTKELYGEKKDAGEAALADPNGLAKRVMAYCEQAYNLRAERDKAAEIEAYKRSGAGMVDAFLQDIQTEEFKPISSGISVIDDAIGGGFIRKSVIMLGAAPGMGKTALLSQICENIARRTGEDILYINLEMSREILLARSIARIANEGGKKVLTVNEILRGYEWEKKEGLKEIIANAAEEYKETIANHLLYNPGTPTTDFDQILQKIEEEKRRLGHAPIVCIDYLQLLTGNDAEDNIAVIKRAMLTLKHYANDNGTLVFMITANNRESMKTGQSGLISGRDSSNIEYGADLHLGLEYEAVSSKAKVEEVETDNGSKVKAVKLTKGKDLDYINTVKREYALLQAKDPGTWTEEDYTIEDAYQKYCTSYVVRVNKNRFLESERVAKLIFDGASARFLPLDPHHEEVRDYSNAYKPKLKPIEDDTEDLPFR